jgi:hypothetical protein
MAKHGSLESLLGDLINHITNTHQLFAFESILGNCFKTIRYQPVLAFSQHKL